MNQEQRRAYLKRIGIEKEPPVSRESLEKLLKAHLENIPFENLDVYDFGRVPSLEEAALFDKVVAHHRGGFCFELNTLFARLLESLGFQVYPVAVRVLWNKDFFPPVAHMALIVSLEKEKYFCDVGYGGPGPKGLMLLEESARRVSGETFRMTCVEGDIRIDRLHHEEWKALLRFTDCPMRWEDVQVLNFYCARSENILFTRRRVLNLCTPMGSKALMDMELTVADCGEKKQTVYRDLKELEAGLEKEFGITVSLAESSRKEDCLFG